MIKKAVLLAGGMGTRFLPVTKVLPKEIFPILNKPAMQLIIEELANSGIEEVIVVINNSKRLIKEYFTPNENLEKFLKSRNLGSYIEEIQNIDRLKTTFVIQKSPLGSANAVECAKPYIQGEDFVILNGDDLMFNEGLPVTKQLIDCYEKYGKTIIGGQKVPLETVLKCGMLVGSTLDGRAFLLEDIIEKPRHEMVTSNLVSLGRYIVKFEIFEEIKKIQIKNGEVYLTAALASLARRGKALAYEFEGIRYDLGSIPGFILANVEYALRDPKLKSPIKEALKMLLKE